MSVASRQHAVFRSGLGRATPAALAATVARIEQRRVLMAHLGRLGRARKRIPPQAQPDNLRLGYFRALRALMRDARAMALGKGLPELRALIREARTSRGDSLRLDAGPGKRVQAIIDAVASSWRAKHPPEELAALATRYGNATSTHNREQLGRQLKSTVGVDVFAREPALAPRIEKFAAENVSLISTMATDTFAQVERVAVAALYDGDRAESLREDLVERFDVSESRAKLIARDQIGKLNGELNQIRQQALGIGGYVWRTMGDDRVRDEHAALEGERFAWDESPAEGPPGFPINCRCYAEPDLEELFGDLDGEDPEDGGDSSSGE